MAKKHNQGHKTKPNTTQNTWTRKLIQLKHEATKTMKMEEVGFKHTTKGPIGSHVLNLLSHAADRSSENTTDNRGRRE